MKLAAVAWLISLGSFALLVAQAELPAKLKDLSAKYETALSEADGGISQLKESYSQRLDALAREAQAKGELDNVMVIKTELQKVATEAPGTESQYEPLAQAQQLYHEHAQIAKERSYPDWVRIEETYVGALDSLIAEYTRNGELENALATKKAKEEAEKRLGEWTRLAGMEPTGSSEFDEEDWARLRKIVASDQLSKSAPVGGVPANGPTTKDLPEEGAILIGFDLLMAEFGGSRQDTVRTMIPLWKTEKNSKVEGIPRARANGQRRRVVAKDGFAIGGISTVSDAGVRKVKFKFQPINGFGLSEIDAYETEWYGDWDEGREAEATTNGKLAVGIDGWVGLGTNEFWLLCADPK